TSAANGNSTYSNVANATTTSTGSVTVSFQDGSLPTSSYGGTRDTYLSQTYPTVNYGASQILIADGDDVSGFDLASALKWDLSSLPPGSTITAASITFYVTNSTTDHFEVYQLLRDWVESQATWNLAATGVSWALPGALD